MMRVEAAHQHQDIRDIIVGAIASCPNGKAAASFIGCSESNLSHWVQRTGIADEVDLIKIGKKLQVDPELFLQSA